MNDEKWNLLVERAKEKFDDVSLSTEDIIAETSEGLVKQGTKDILEFSNPAGTFRVVRESRPVLLEKKMHYSHRQGDAARSEYVFSDSEFSHKVCIYKENLSGDWEKIDSENLNIF